MLFVQEEDLDDLVDYLDSYNDISTEFTLAKKYIQKIQEDYDTLIDIFIEHKDNVKTCYYGLSEVVVSVGSKVNQGDKLGVSGTTEIDSEAGNHVYFQILKNNKNLNPEKQIGKKITDL